MPTGRIPWSIAAFSPDSFVVVYSEPDSTFSLGVLDTLGNYRSRASFLEPVRVLYGGGGTWVAYDDATLIFSSLEPVDSVPLLASGNDTTGSRVIAAAVRGSMVWFVALSETDTTLNVVQVSTSRSLNRLRTWSLHSLGYLSPVSQSRAVFAQVRSPHVIHVFDIDQESPDTMTVGLPGPPYNPRSVRTVSVVVLDCGLALLTLADLRSVRRWLALLDIANNRLVRITTIDEPLGVYQAAPEEQLLYGFSDRPGARRLIVWRVVVATIRDVAKESLMTKRPIGCILGMWLVLVLAPAPAAAQNQCFECINCSPTAQCCIQGSWGEVCSYYYFEGFRYCSTSGPGNCGDGDPEDPGGELAISPAGTFIPSPEALVLGGRHVCTKFIVSFQTKQPAPKQAEGPEVSTPPHVAGERQRDRIVI